MSEKILSVDADDGIVCASAETFAELYKDLKASVEKCPDMLSMLHKKRELAVMCERAGMWSEAVDLNYDILRCGGITEYRKNPKSELGMLALEAYRAISSIHGSDDECIWEMCSQIIGDVGEYFEAK